MNLKKYGLMSLACGIFGTMLLVGGNGCTIPDIDFPPTPTTTTTTTTTSTTTTTTSTTTTTIPDNNGNVPPFTSQTDMGPYMGLPRNFDGRLCAKNEFHGTVKCSNAEAATNWRYGFRGYMEHKIAPNGVQTGYATPDNPRHGVLSIQVDGASVNWWVID